MIRVVIVEDEILVSDHLNSILSKNDFSVVAIAENIEEAMNALSLSPELYLLDIRLGEKDNGIDLGGKLHKLDIPFIYITANNEIEVLKKAVSTEPVTYITKPFNERDILAAVELVRFKLKNERSISIIGKKGTQELLEQDILFCKADGVYTEIYTTNDTIIQRVKLKDLEDKLAGNFVRIHRSFIVNIDKITSRKTNSVFVGDMELPVSRTFKAALP